MVEYKAVVEELLAHFEQNQKAYASGEMMSLAESVHGEIHSSQSLALINSLLEKHVRQPTNRQDAEDGNINAIRHVAYGEGYQDGKDFLQAKIDLLAEALMWYEEQTRLCRLIHSEGAAGRRALDSDGGAKARAALACIR